MNIDKFEQQAKKLFEGYKPETDNDQIWQNIEPHLKKKKKRRAFLIFFWGLGMALLLGLLWCNQVFTNPADQQASHQVNTAPVGEATQNPMEAYQGSSGNRTSVNEGNTQVSDNTAEKAGISERHVAPIRTHSEKKGTLETAKQKTTAKSDMPQGGQASAIGDASNSPTSVEQRNQAQPPAAPGNSSELRSEEGNSPEMAPKTEPKSMVTADANVDNNGKTAVKEKKASTIPLKKPVHKKSHKAKKSKNGLRHSITLQAGPVLPIKSLGRNSSVNGSTELLKNRRSSENMLEAFSAGTHYTIVTKNGLLFRAGIIFQRQNERFKVSYTDVKEEFKVGVIAVTEDQYGAVVDRQYGLKKITTTTEYNNVAYNRYQYLNLPFGAGFQQSNKKSSWELAGGLDINLWFRFNGTIYNPTGTPARIQYPNYGFTGIDNEGVYKKRLSMGIWASYGYSRKISKHIKWQASASLQTPFSALTTKSYPLLQRYVNFGVQGGLVFNLGKGK